MRNFLTKSVLATTLAASALAAAAPAEAQYYRGGRGYHRGGDSTGAAIAGGIVGLALGAAIASSANRDRGYYRERGYYEQPYYSQPRYNGYYEQNYYRPRCRIERRYDGYYGRPYDVRVCY